MSPQGRTGTVYNQQSAATTGQSDYRSKVNTRAGPVLKDTGDQRVAHCLFRDACGQFAVLAHCSEEALLHEDLNS
jgi:hypothetical protein